MSKTRKQPVERSTGISELDIKFEKIIQFSGWIFLLALGAFMGAWVLFDCVPDYFNIESINLINLELEAMTYSFIVFAGTSSALSFGLSTKVRKNRDRKKEFFTHWLIGEFLLCMMSIFSVAVYVW